jgi:hypothetical protein
VDREEQPASRNRELTDVEVQFADEILRRLGIRYVVVGGQAVARSAATATRDVDVMVATGDYARTVMLLRKEKELALDWDDGTLCRFRILARGGLPLDVINGSAFAGKPPGRDFFRFLAEEQSSTVDGIAYASPEAVWYTRLLTKRWQAYAEKIVTNMIDGVSPDRLAAVEELGRRFGTEATLADRVEYVREGMRRPDVAELLRRAVAHRARGTGERGPDDPSPNAEQSASSRR